MLGRIAAIKMNVLPKLVFLFQNLPIPSTVKILNEKKALKKCTWQYKRARIKSKHLQDCKENGAFALPNFHIYYQASVLTWLKNWIMFQDSQILGLEDHDLPFEWHTYLLMDGKTPSIFTNHFLSKSLLRTWKILSSFLYPKMPLWVSLFEAIATSFLLSSKPLTYANLLNKDGTLKSLNQL